MNKLVVIYFQVLKISNTRVEWFYLSLDNHWLFRGLGLEQDVSGKEALKSKTLSFAFIATTLEASCNNDNLREYALHLTYHQG